MGPLDCHHCHRHNRHYKKDLPELYNMMEDPQENFNVASFPDHAEVGMVMTMVIR